MSETSKVREFVEKYCVGEGLDIGCGEDKIVLNAIGIDFSNQYKLSDHPETVADYKNGWENFFKENHKLWDFIYSSHLIEDYSQQQIDGMLNTWVDNLKIGGYLILVFPHEELYKKLGVNINSRHCNNWRSAMDFFESLSEQLRFCLNVIDFSFTVVVDYNLYIVLQKNGV